MVRPLSYSIAAVSEPEPSTLLTSLQAEGGRVRLADFAPDTRRRKTQEQNKTHDWDGSSRNQNVILISVKNEEPGREVVQFSNETECRKQLAPKTKNCTNPMVRILRCEGL